ncbi:MAG TPA: MOSC N-terminal beta barrel domain-containing protein [Stellaceae bacterium]|jgi:hypothetical protein
MTTDLGVISELWRYPVKSMGGERIESAKLGEHGIVGDRAFAIYDGAGKLVSTRSNKHAEHIGRLLELAAMTLEGRVLIRLPDGRTFDVGDSAVDDALSAIWGARLTLLRDDNVGHRDAAALHVLTESSLHRLRFFLPDRSVSPRRFRPNFVISSVAEAVPDSEWIGRTIGIGRDLRIRITKRTVRGINVALANGELPREPAILRVLADQCEGCLGVFAEVERGGIVRCGDEVYFAEDERAGVALEHKREHRLALEAPRHPTSAGDYYVSLGSIAARFPLLRVHCERCDLHSLYRTGKLIQKYGTEPHSAVMREAVTAECPHRRERTAEASDGCVPGFPDLPGWL